MDLSLPTHQLEAFAAVARLGSVSQAARELHVSQSALSQRLLNLEDLLQSALFIREPKGLRLTPAGEKLVRYCRQKEMLDQGLLTEFAGTKGKLFGTIRVGGFSSLVRSRAIPALATLLRANPEVRLELFTRETRELLPMLQRNEVDFIFSFTKSDRDEIEHVLVGEEENVLVRPRKITARENVFLDHDAQDTTTADFWKIQKITPRPFRRDFFDEVYALQDGVALGLGQAVLPRHLVKHDKRLEIVAGLKPLRLPVYLLYYRQAYYSKLFEKVRAVLSVKL